MQRHLIPSLAAALLATAPPGLAQDEDAVPDLRKSMVELPLKNVLAPETVTLQTPLAGLVRWHESFDAAREAASRSDKPILLFQLLGRLDEEFC